MALNRPFALLAVASLVPLASALSPSKAAAAVRSDAPKGCFAVGGLKVDLPPGWLAGRDPRDEDPDDAYLISPHWERDAEVQIIVTTYPDAGSLDAFVADQRRSLKESPNLRERFLSQRRALAADGLPVVDLLSDAKGGMRFLTRYAVVDGRGYVFAGRAPARKFARYQAQLAAVLATLRRGKATAACAPTFLYTLIPEEQMATRSARYYLWLRPEAVEAKLDFESEARRTSDDGVCDIKVVPFFEPQRSAPVRLEMTAVCGSRPPMRRTIPNTP